MSSSNMGKSDVSVKKFNMEDMCAKPFCGVLCGKRGSGKSFLIKDILYHMHQQKFPRACIFSQTEGANKYFTGFVPGIFIHSPFSMQSLDKIWHDQKELVMKKTLGMVPADADTRLLILLDDCAFDKKILASKSLKELHLNGRHFNVTCLITLQYLIDMPPVLRQNVDYGFFLKDNVRINREKLYKHFCGFYGDFKTFEAVFEACTSDYECFCVDNTKNSTDHEDIVSYYKAQTRDFKFGSQQIWDFHYKMFVSEEEEYLEKQQKLAKRRDSSTVKTVGNTSITVTRHK